MIKPLQSLSHTHLYESVHGCRLCTAYQALDLSPAEVASPLSQVSQVNVFLHLSKLGHLCSVNVEYL